MYGLERLGVKITSEQAFLIFKSLDRDNDNMISFKEFAGILTTDKLNIYENKKTIPQ